MAIDRFTPCRKCRDLKGPKPGYYFIKNDKGFETVKECSCHKDWRRRKFLEVEYVLSNVVESHTFKNYTDIIQDQENINYLKGFAENFKKFSKGTMIYLYGQNGTMKTSMSKYAGQLIIQQGFSVQYIMMQELVEKLVMQRESEEKLEERDQILKRCKDVDLLIIDEAFDRSKVMVYKSGFQIPYLDFFLKDRFDTHKKSILFISNVKPEDISAIGFGDSLQDFVVRNTRESQIFFNEKYVDNAARGMDPHGIFKR